MKLLAFIRNNGWRLGLVLIFSTISARFYSKYICFVLGVKRSHFGRIHRISGSTRISFGDGLYIQKGAWIEAIQSYGDAQYDPRIVVGRNVCSSPDLHISAIGQIKIGDGCLFGSRVSIIDHNHGNYSKSAEMIAGLMLSPAQRPLHSRAGISIGAGCWLGDNVVVLAGADIGDGAVIGANSVVTGFIPAFSIAAGSPARILRQLK